MLKIHQDVRSRVAKVKVSERNQERKKGTLWDLSRLTNKYSIKYFSISREWWSGNSFFHQLLSLPGKSWPLWAARLLQSHLCGWEVLWRSPGTGSEGHEPGLACELLGLICVRLTGVHGDASGWTWCHNMSRKLRKNTLKSSSDSTQWGYIITSDAIFNSRSRRTEKLLP